MPGSAASQQNPVDNWIFLQARCYSCCPTGSIKEFKVKIKAPKGKAKTRKYIAAINSIRI